MSDLAEKIKPLLATAQVLGVTRLNLLITKRELTTVREIHDLMHEVIMGEVKLGEDDE